MFVEMKYITNILIVFFLYLSIKPGVENLLNNSMIVQSCCGDVCIQDFENETDEDKNCDGKACNPFQICGSCVLFCMKSSFQSEITQLKINTTKGFTFYSIFISKFASDFWQPPKIV